MIEQNVQVLQTDDDRIWVRMGAQTGCSACDNGKGCGAGLFAKLLGNKPVILELARGGLKVEAGQMVTLALKERVYLGMVFTSYGWPILAALAGATGGHALGAWLGLAAGATDAVTLAGGILAAWLIMRLTRRTGAADVLLGALDMSVCNPSETPGMCMGKAQKQNTINTF